MIKRFILIITILPFFLVNVSAEPAVRVKNLTYISGYKKNQVYGFGLVTGLPNTGDSKSNLTRSSVKNLLNSLGIQENDPVTKNIAAVLVTADLPPHIRIGERVDVSVSSIGDARSIEGGILIQSPLRGADDNIYVVAQGKLPESQGNNRNRVKTVSSISGGGIVEKEIRPEYILTDDNNIKYIALVLKNWDYSTADKIIKGIKGLYTDLDVSVINGGRIKVPLKQDVPISEFISKIENIEIIPEYRAVVIVNERDGTVVAGGNIVLSEALVSRRGMTVQIENSDLGKNVSMIAESTTIKDLVDSLNAIGAGTDDIIVILKALKESGSIHAELIIR
jgi:flagellar P-ring protein precursor FlgI